MDQLTGPVHGRGNRPLNVLLVEDSEHDAELILSSLRNAGFILTCRRVQTAAKLSVALEQGCWDAVICDFKMPGFGGMDALRMFREAGLDIPFILVSGAIGEAIAVDAMTAGASDYIMKNNLARLAPALERELKETRIRAEHRRAQGDLVDSEARFRSLTALSSDWYWEQDDQFRFTYVSPGANARFGDPPDSWNGKTRFDLWYRGADWTEHRATLANRQPFRDVQLQPIEVDGRSVYVSVSGEPKFDAEGRFAGYRGVARDITEQVKRTNDLLRFRTAMDATDDAITLMSRATLHFVEVNATACKMLGYTREELLELGPAELSGADVSQLEGVYDAVIRGALTSEPAEITLKRKDGSHLLVEIRWHVQRAIDDWIIVGVLRDITERNDAENKIKRLNRMYAVLSGINGVIVRVHNRDELFREACRIAVERGEFKLAWIGIVDRTTMKIESIAAAGSTPEYQAFIKDQFSRSADLADNTLTACAIRERRACFSNDTDKDPKIRFKQQHVDGGTRSIAALPLMVTNEAVGALVLYAGEADFFDPKEVSLLTELAGNIAFAIDHIDKQERLDYLAYYDPLTGLANAALFLERVAQYIRSATASGHTLALYLIDLERFKNINDSLGQPAGDALLRQVAEWLVHHLKDASLLARVGADHFAVVLPHARDERGVARLLEKMVTAFLEHPFRLNDAVFRIAAKVGVAMFPADGANADTLFKHAEAALKKAKASGDRYLFYTQKMTETVAGKLSLENKLRRALERDEFVLHYQPKVNLATGMLTGAEALIRWNEPDKGLVAPGVFIPVLEEIGLIHDVGRWALQQALRDYLRWRAAGLAAVRVAVNVSALQLGSRGFIAEIEQATGIDRHAAAGLELEITESLVMADVKHSIASLKAIRAMGITVAIDDFGTGYSTLSYLSRLPIDTLKIDRSFISEMTTNPQGLALVSGIIGLAHALKLNVVAEGVETEDQSGLLRSLRCDEMQGFLFSRPLPVEVFEARFLSPLQAA